MYEVIALSQQKMKLDEPERSGAAVGLKDFKASTWLLPWRGLQQLPSIAVRIDGRSIYVEHEAPINWLRGATWVHKAVI